MKNESKENQKLKEIVELIVVRMDKNCSLDIIYSDALVYLLSSNPREEVKKYILNSMESLIDKINEDITSIKEKK